MVVSFGLNRIYNNTLDVWTDKKAIEQAGSAYLTDGVRSAVHNRDIYVMGGRDQAGPTYFDHTSKYNMDTNTWEDMESMPADRWQGMCERVGNKIYYIGGKSGTADSTAVVTVYDFDITTGHWGIALTDCPGSVFNAASFVLGTTIFIVGGKDSASAQLQLVRTYNTATDTWGVKANIDLPVGDEVFNSGFGIAYNGLGYVFGGTGAAARDDAFSYEPVTDAWTALTVLPAIRSKLAGFSTTGSGGRIYLCGGEDNVGAASATVQRYNIVSNDYSARASLLTARKDACSGFVADSSSGGSSGGGVTNNAQAFVIGGQIFAGSDNRADNEGYDHASGTWYDQYAEIASGSGVQNSSHVSDGVRYIYVCGGNLEGTGVTDKVWRYDTQLDSWDDMAVMPAARIAGNVCYSSKYNYIWYMKGEDSGFTELNTLFQYDIAANTWSTLTADSATAVSKAPCLYYNDKLFQFGGTPNNTSSSAQTRIFDLINQSWSAGAALPATRAEGTGQWVSSNGGRFYLFGGRHWTGGPTSHVDDDIYEYDPGGDAWVDITSVDGDIMPHDFFIGTSWRGADGKIYITGGTDGVTLGFTTLTIYNPTASAGSRVTSVASSMPLGRYHLSDTSGVIYT